MKFPAAVQVAKRIPGGRAYDLGNKHWVVVILREDGHAICLDSDGIEEFDSFESLYKRKIDGIVNKIPFTCITNVKKGVKKKKKKD